MVAFIHREEYYDRENGDLKGNAEIIIAKQRNGPTGSVQLAYLSDFTRFEFGYCPRRQLPANI